MKDSNSHLPKLPGNLFGSVQENLHEDSDDPAQRCRLGAVLPYNQIPRKRMEA